MFLKFILRHTKKNTYNSGDHKAIMINDMCSIKFGIKMGKISNANTDTFVEFVMCTLCKLNHHQHHHRRRHHFSTIRFVFSIFDLNSMHTTCECMRHMNVWVSCKCLQPIRSPVCHVCMLFLEHGSNRKFSPLFFQFMLIVLFFASVIGINESTVNYGYSPQNDAHSNPTIINCLHRFQIIFKHVWKALMTHQHSYHLKKRKRQ